MLYLPRLNPDAPVRLPTVLPSVMDELFNSAMPAPEMLVPPPQVPRKRTRYFEFIVGDYDDDEYPQGGWFGPDLEDGHPDNFGDK